MNRETFIEVATQIFLMAPETAEQYADEAENYGRTYESVLGAFADVVVGNRKRAIRDEFNSDLARACAIGSYTQLVNGGIRERPCNGDVIRAATLDSRGQRKELSCERRSVPILRLGPQDAGQMRVLPPAGIHAGRVLPVLGPVQTLRGGGK